LQRFLNDPFAFLRPAPVHWIDDPEYLDAVIELGDGERRQASQFTYRNFSKISGARFLDACTDTLQAFQLMYAALPQHQAFAADLDTKLEGGCCPGSRSTRH
jgi:hypothetical protein